MSHPLVISQPTIESIFYEHGITPDKLWLPDPQYSILEPGWFSSHVLPKWTVWRDEYLGKYVPNETDCDDYAEGLDFFVDLLHRRTPGHPVATPAFGQFALPTHDINVMVTKNRELIFIEPQESRFIELTKEEIQSCEYAPF